MQDIIQILYFLVMQFNKVEPVLPVQGLFGIFDVIFLWISNLYTQCPQRPDVSRAHAY